MKKFVTLLGLLSSSFILIGCNNSPDASSSAVPPGEINLYNGQQVSNDNYSFMMNSYSYNEYQDHRLELTFGLKITNISDHASSYTIQKAKAYGNDEELTEQVLKSFDYEDKSKNQLFTTEEGSLDKNDSYNLNLILVIQDGNPLAKFKINFDFNDININLYAHDEGYEPEHFTYIHNPSLYSKVLVDVDEDTNAIYGYKPNDTGSLKQFVDYAWNDKDAVAGYKQERIKYIDENDKIIHDLENKLREEGKSIEEIARACSNQRNQNRLDQYKDDPEGLAKLKERNLEQYGNEDGPTPEWLFDRYGSWEIVLEKCYATNAGMDAACGVYDMYFCMYVALPY